MNVFQPPAYDHTQKGPWFLLLFAVGAICLWLSSSGMMQGDPVAAIVFPILGWSMALLGLSFQTLTVVDEGDRLAVRFGPVPLFRKRIPYEEMREVSTGRLTIFDGWGIHLSLRGGWVWSIWGLDCVVVRYRRRTLRIGTDDAENLARFLQSRLPDRVQS